MIPSFVSPIHFGPMSAWSVIVIGVLLLALTEHFRRTFQSKTEAGTDKKEICDRLDRLERAVEKVDTHIRDGRGDEKLITRVEFNGVAQRINAHDAQITSIEAEARTAARTAELVSSDVRHLTKRIDDLIEPLAKKVDAIYNWKMLEHRDEPRGG